MHILSIRDLAELVEGRMRLGDMPPLGGELEPIGPIRTELRQIRPGDLFWELESTRNGVSWRAEEAFCRGAAGAVVGRRIEPWAGGFGVQVDDTLEALWRIAQWSRGRFRGSVVAVAGPRTDLTSVMIDRVLSLCGPCHRASRSCRPEADLPLGMIGADEDHDFAVLPVVAPNAQRFDKLAHLCCPHVAVITGHVDPYADRRRLRIDDDRHSTTPEILSREIAPAGAVPAAAIARAVPDGGAVVVNGDDGSDERVERRFDRELVRYGTSRDCDVTARDVRADDEGLEFKIRSTTFSLPGQTTGELGAVLAAVAVGALRRLPLSLMADALRESSSIPTRNTENNPNTDADGIALKSALPVLKGRDARERNRRFRAG